LYYKKITLVERFCAYVNGLIHMAELKRKQKEFGEAKKYIDHVGDKFGI